MAIVRGPLNSAAPTTSILGGGVYNAVPPAPQDTQECAFQLDANGNLKVVQVGGGVASIVQIEDTAGNPLTSTAGSLNVNLTGGTIIATNPSVGLTGAVAPTSATEIGIVVGGNLVNVSAANPVPVSGTVAVTQSTSPWVVSGTVTANQGTSPWVVSGTVTATNSSVGAIGVAAPGFATEFGWVNGSGNLVDVSAATPLPVSGSFSSAGTLTNNNAPPTSDNVGSLPALANAASPTWVEGNQVLESVDLSGRQRVRGTLTNDTAASVSDAISSLNYVANATAPTWTEGNLVHGSVDLSGNTRVIGTKVNNSAAPTTEVGVLAAVANAAPPSWVEGRQVLLSEDLSGNLRVITATGSTTAVTGNVTVVQPTGTNLHVVVDSLPLTTSTSGTLSNNSAAPVADNLGVLPALANASNPSWTEGDQVLLSEDLSGNLRVKVNAPLPAGANVIGHVITDTGSTTVVTGSVAVTGTFFQATQPVSGTVTANQGNANTPANSWPVEVTDGTNVLFTAAHPGFIQGAITLASTTITGTVAVTQSTSPWVVSGTVTLSGLQNVNVTQWNTVALGSPSAYGTSPGAVNVIGVNAFITNTPAVTLASTTITGSVAVTGTFFQAIQPVSGTVTANQGTSPWVVSLASTTITGTVAVTQSTSPWVVSLASTTITGTVAENLTQVAGVVLGATAVTAFGVAPAAANVPGVNSSIFAGTTGITATGSSLNVNVTNSTGSTVSGSLTNNNAAPAANNLGVLPAFANAANPTWTEGNQVLLSEDLSGRLRITGQVADEAAFTGNPVTIAGVDSAGNVELLPISAQGDTMNGVNNVLIVGGVDSSGLASRITASSPGNAGDGITLKSSVFALADATSNNEVITSQISGTQIYNSTLPFVFNGATWDRTRSATIGNAVAATGIAVAAAYGEYLSTAPAPTTGKYSALQTDYAGSLFVKPIRRSTTVSQATTIASSSAATTILAAGGAGIFTDISTLIITVTAAATTSLPFTATLSDGTKSFIFDMETGSLTTAASPIFQINFNPPIAATTAATVWTLALSVATVTVHVSVNAVLQAAS